MVYSPKLSLKFKAPFMYNQFFKSEVRKYASLQVERASKEGGKVLGIGSSTTKAEVCLMDMDGAVVYENDLGH